MGAGRVRKVVARKQISTPVDREAEGGSEDDKVDSKGHPLVESEVSEEE